MQPAFVLLTCAILAAPSTAGAQTRPATLIVTVQDPSGAVIPAAAVDVRDADAPPERATHGVSDGRGVAAFRDLKQGRYVVVVSFPGFDAQTLTDVRLRGGETRRVVTLPIQKLDERVSVGRDPATAASDPKSDRFGSVLSKDQIDALPDDPDEMEAQLNAMAGPGATIRVDGFRGGKLPPKSQIRSIRFSSGMFAAENHGAGFTFVDIATQPGLGPIQAGVDYSVRSGALDARNAFQAEKGPEQTQTYTLNLSGTLVKNRTSFSVSAGGASLYDSTYLYAASPDGPRNGNIRRPSDRLNVSARVDHALTRTHSLRASYQQNDGTQHNLGVGGFDYPERGYTRTVNESLFRVSESGPLGRAWFGESRLQLHWTTTGSEAVMEAPTVRVLDAFTAGGAQQAGTRRATELEWATNLDWAHKRHSLRIGSLVEGGTYSSDLRSNYLGTYTFESLADFDAGRPSTFEERIGNPRVRYSQWQAGLFAQDDWRARKNLTLSAGLRYELQTHAGDAANAAPRAGFTWSPFKNGKTTIRGGAGIFYDWLDATTFEQTLRVDGVHQQDLVIVDPAFPDALASAPGQILPPSRYELSPSLTLPRRTAMMAGLTQQLSPTLGVNLMFSHSRASNRLRGRNVNAPLDGVRPVPALGNVIDVESSGRAQGYAFNAGMNYAVPQRRTFLFANYTWVRQRNDADGPFSLPADNYDLAAEWGPAANVPTHSASGMLSTSLPKRIRLAVSATARSGLPYTITTGRDDNGDTVFTDRPSGVGRNTARGQGMWDAAARVSYAFGFGDRRQSSGGGPQAVMIRMGGPAAAGDLLGAVSGPGGAEDRRVRFELYASVQNLFNTVNPIGYSGVMTSPFFMRPTAAAPARKIDLGMKIGF